MLSKGRLQRIFALMQVNYGSLWVNNVGTDELLKVSFDVWGKKLAGLTDTQIKRGLDNLPPEFPPSPVKFRDLCVGAGNGLTHNTAAYNNNWTENRINSQKSIGMDDETRELEKVKRIKRGKQAIKKIREMSK